MQDRSRGFTLLEISIVLVIIGLLVGGIFIGRELLGTAEIRGAISHINQYKAAVVNFRNKYGSLPGDMPAYKAARFGFNTRAGGVGDGDGNGRVGGKGGALVLGGETVLFWTDLSSANLIDQRFTDNADAIVTYAGSAGAIYYDAYLPATKLPSRARIIAYNSGLHDSALSFNIIPVLRSDAIGITYYPQAMNPAQAYSIDSKMDDGIPGTGVVKESDGGRFGLQGYVGSGPVVYGSGNNDCAVSTAKYNLIYPDPVACNLIIKIQ